MMYAIIKRHQDSQVWELSPAIYHSRVSAEYDRVMAEQRNPYYEFKIVKLVELKK